MKPAAEWAAELSRLPVRTGVELVTGRGPDPSLRVDGVLFHSLYQPREEAQRLIESANLQPGRPVIVIGLGLGYHVAALLAGGYEVAIIEPEIAVAKLAIEGPLGSAEFRLRAISPAPRAVNPPDVRRRAARCRRRAPSRR